MIWVIGGTTEGRTLAKRLSELDISAVLTVASETGAECAGAFPGVDVRVGRLSAGAMEELIAQGVSCVLDATHPYAVEVSAQACGICERLGTPYLRVKREATELPSGAVVVNGAGEAAEYLSKVLFENDGARALLATGVKTLREYTIVKDYEKKLIPRVLPDVDSLIACKELGFKNIIAMQGPFSFEMNVATIMQYGVKYMVTKDGGGPGGAREKILAAKACGAELIWIGRPQEHESGMTCEQALVSVCSIEGKEYKKNEESGGAQPAKAEALGRFPIFIDIKGKICTIAGGGKVAARRAASLIECGGCVRAIAPEFSPSMPGGVQRIEREWCAGDSENSALCVAATNDRSVNSAVTHECVEKHIPVSCADDPQASTFHFPAIISAGGATIGAISGNPAYTKALSARMRGVLSAVFGGEETGDWVRKGDKGDI